MKFLVEDKEIETTHGLESTYKGKECGIYRTVDNTFGILVKGNTQQPPIHLSEDAFILLCKSMQLIMKRFGMNTTEQIDGREYGFDDVIVQVDNN